MTRIEIDIKGINKTIRKMSLKSDEMKKEFNKIAKNTARKVERRAKSNAPVGPTGNLKQSIRHRKVRRSDGPAYTVFPRSSGRYKGYHRHWIEYGTDRRKNTGRKYKGRRVGKIKSNPFMQPAERSVQGEYIRSVKEVVRENGII